MIFTVQRQLPLPVISGDSPAALTTRVTDDSHEHSKGVLKRK
jgi:hypothetical protein